MRELTADEYSILDDVLANEDPAAWWLRCQTDFASAAKERALRDYSAQIELLETANAAFGNPFDREAAMAVAEQKSLAEGQKAAEDALAKKVARWAPEYQLRLEAMGGGYKNGRARQADADRAIADAAAAANAAAAAEAEAAARAQQDAFQAAVAAEVARQLAAQKP